MYVSPPPFHLIGIVSRPILTISCLYQDTRASLLAQGPLSGGFIIDQMFKILVWDD